MSETTSETFRPERLTGTAVKRNAANPRQCLLSSGTACGTTTDVPPATFHPTPRGGTVKRSERKTPQARAIQRLRAEGFEVEVVEQIKRIPGRTWRKDLFGAFDLLAVNGVGDIKAVQVTSRSNVASRVNKLADLPVLGWLRKAGWGLHVWGWGRTKTKGDWLEVDVS